MSQLSTGQSKLLGRKLTSSALAERYSVSVRTIDRWLEDKILPEPMRIHKVRYWDEAEIEQLERERMARSKSEPETAA